MNKITKLLSVFVIAGAIGTGIVGAVGCKPTPTPEGHTHSYGQTGEDLHNGKHRLTCSTCEEGTEGHTKDEAHVDANNDEKCDVCQADMASEDPNAITKVEIKADKEEGIAGDVINLSVEVLPATASDKTVTWSIIDGDDLATITQEGVLTIKADAKDGGEVTVKATSNYTNKKSDTYTVIVNKITKYHELSADTANNIVSKDFETAETLTEFSGTYGTKGLYYYGDESATTKGGTVTVAEGVAKHTTGASGSTKTENLSFVVDLGATKEVVEGYVKWTPDAMGGDWSFMRIVGTSEKNTSDKTVFAIHTKDSNGKIDYLLDGKSTKPEDGGTAHSTKDEISVASNTTYELYFKVNVVTGAVTVKVDDKFVCENVQTTIKSVKGLSFVSSNGGLRQCTFDNLAVNTYDIAVADVVTDLKANATAFETKVNELKNVGANNDSWQVTDETTGTAAKLTAAMTALNTALDAQDVTKAGAVSAYATYNSAVYTALAGEYLARLQAAYPESNYTTEGETGAVVGVDENVKDYKNKKDDAIAAFGAVDSLDGFETVLLAQKGIFKDIPDNERLNKAKVTITISDGETTIGTLNAKDGDSVTKAQLDEVATVAATKKITGYKTDSLTGTDVEFPYAATAVDSNSDGKKDDTAITLYAVIVDKEQKTATLDVASVSATAYTEDTLINGIFYGTSKAKSESAKCNTAPTTPVEGTTYYTKQVSLTGGKAAVADGVGSNAIKFTVPSECTVKVVAAFKKTTTTAALAVLGTDGKAATVTELKKGEESIAAFDALPAVTDTKTDAIAVTYTFKLAAGTYFLGGAGGGAYLYEVVVNYME